MINQISPFAGFTDFFKPVYSDRDASFEHEKETFSCLRESINLFDFGQKGYTLLPEVEDDALLLVEREGSTQSWSEIAIRITKIATIIIPLIHLVGAAIYFLANDFQLHALEDTEDAEDTDNAFVEHTFIQIENTTTPGFDMLSDDLIGLFFKYLGPACFQLASTDTRTYELMNGDLSLEKYRVGREALKRCFALKSISNIKTVENLRGQLIKNLCAFDLQEAFKKAKSNDDLKFRVSDLVKVSEAFAKFDEKKSLEVLDYAYKEVHSIGQRVKSFLKAISNGRIECFDRFEALTKLIKTLNKKSNIEKANRIINEVNREFPKMDEYPDAILKSAKIFLSVELLKCREAETMEMGKTNIRSNIELIFHLYCNKKRDEAKFLVEDLIEFLNRFIEKFPEAQKERIDSLLNLLEILDICDTSRAYKLATAMVEEQSADLHNPENYMNFLRVLLTKDGRIEGESINKALEMINLVEQENLIDHISYLLDLSELIISSDKARANELAELASIRMKMGFSNFYIQDQKVFLTMMAFDASRMLARNNLELAVEMFNLAKGSFEYYKKILPPLQYPEFENFFIDVMNEGLREITKQNSVRGKEIAEDFETPCVKLIALSSVVQAIIEK
ncbi:MAG: hypothetical protein H0T62_12595 [Parachlamydiaceae bacterium]|nr:hypothetical protein [Parachlamydiaceae bacterium]